MQNLRNLISQLFFPTNPQTLSEETPLMINTNVESVSPFHRLSCDAIRSILEYLSADLSATLNARLAHSAFNKAFLYSPSSLSLFFHSSAQLFEEAFLQKKVLRNDSIVIFDKETGDSICLPTPAKLLSESQLTDQSEFLVSLIFARACFCSRYEIDENLRPIFYKGKNIPNETFPKNITRYQQERREHIRASLFLLLTSMISLAALLYVYLYNIGPLMVSINGDCDSSGGDEFSNSGSDTAISISCDYLRRNASAVFPPTTVYNCFWTDENQMPLPAAEIVKNICDVAPSCDKGFNAIFGRYGTFMFPKSASYKYLLVTFCQNGFSLPEQLGLLLAFMITPVYILCAVNFYIVKPKFTSTKVSMGFGHENFQALQSLFFAPAASNKKTTRRENDQATVVDITSGASSVRR